MSGLAGSVQLGLSGLGNCPFWVWAGCSMPGLGCQLPSLGLLVMGSRSGLSGLSGCLHRCWAVFCLSVRFGSIVCLAPSGSALGQVCPTGFVKVCCQFSSARWAGCPSAFVPSGHWAGSGLGSSAGSGLTVRLGLGLAVCLPVRFRLGSAWATLSAAWVAGSQCLGSICHVWVTVWAVWVHWVLRVCSTGLSAWAGSAVCLGWVSLPVTGSAVCQLGLPAVTGSVWAGSAAWAGLLSAGFVWLLLIGCLGLGLSVWVCLLLSMSGHNCLSVIGLAIGSITGLGCPPIGCLSGQLGWAVWAYHWAVWLLATPGLSGHWLFFNKVGSVTGLGLSGPVQYTVFNKVWAITGLGLGHNGLSSLSGLGQSQ